MAVLTLNNLLADSRVTQDKGVNGVTMSKWLQGNSSLIPKLASLGYTVDDLINEAYSQTRTNRSAFSGDMTTTPRSNNSPTTNSSISNNNSSGKTILYKPNGSGGYITSTSSNAGIYITNEADLQKYRDQLAKAGIPQSEWSKYITKNADGKMYYKEPTGAWMSSDNMDPNTSNLLNELMAEIDNNANYSTAEKQIMKHALSQSFASGQKIWSKDELTRVLQDAAVNAKESLAPYFEKMKYEDLADYKKSMEDLRLSSALHTQQEAKSYKELLSNTKKQIRKWWGMESWESRQMLGKESALNWARDWGYQFEWVEWELPQQRRYDWEDYSTTQQRIARDKWIEAERKYGSQEIAAIQGDLWKLSNPYDLASWNIDYQAGRYIPSYLAKQKGQDGYTRTGMEQWEGYTGNYWLGRQRDEEIAKQDNLKRYWLYF
jgi:hypothetical protein